MSGTLYTVDICTQCQVNMNIFIQVHKILRMSGEKYSNSVPILVGTYQVCSTFILKISGVKSLCCENVRCTVFLLWKCQVCSISIVKMSGVLFWKYQVYINLCGTNVWCKVQILPNKIRMGFCLNWFSGVLWASCGKHAPFAWKCSWTKLQTH